MVLGRIIKKVLGGSDTSKLGGVPTMKYFDLPGGLAGRGGAVRFFLLAANVELRDEKVTFAEWGSKVKKEVQENGENTAGHLPIIYLNGKTLTEHVAILRFFARKLGMYGRNADKDFLVDQLADEYHTWRAEWALAIGEENDKKKYILEKRSHYYRVFEDMVSKAHGKGGHVVGDGLTFADALVFGILWDDIHCFGNDLLPSHPTLNASYNAFGEHPSIKRWCVAADAAVKPA